MKNNSKLFILHLITFLLHSCAPNAPDENLHDKMIGKLNQYASNFKSKKDAYAVVNMDTLSGLDWEHIYFFHEDSGYPTDANISKVIGINVRSGSIIGNGTRLIFTKGSKILSVVDFSREEALWLYAEQGYNRNKGNKFAFYTNCNYQKSYDIKPLQDFDERTDLSGEFYKPCY